jgi:LacI family transcriptional regulator, galactose operon repressor
VPSGGVKLADVAREAGVHPSTVSRVLSRPELIGEPTREVVQQAIDRLGYVPNRAARQLAGGRTGTIGVLVPDITNPYFARIVRSVQRCCGSSGRTMLLADTDRRHDVEQSNARALAPSVDGFIVCTPITATARWSAIAGAKPLVFVNRRAAGVASVVVDQAAIVRLAVDHLRELGHTSIVAVRGPADYWSARQRDRVIRSLDGVTAVGSLHPDFDAGVRLAAELLDAGVTGVAAFNDQQALGIVAGVRAAGGSVPADLSVVGSDDIDAAAMSSPTLTTVAAPMQQLGETAFATLDRLLAGRSEPASTTLPVTLSIRESTARAPRPPTVKGTPT